MRIAVYGICRDEAAVADRFMASCAGADLVVLADTGSTDDSVERLHGAGAQVHSIRLVQWRFDEARNRALDLVPEDVDVCVSLDLDEILLPGWRVALERAWREDMTRGIYDFILARQPCGMPSRLFRNGRIHARHGYRWRHACHETLHRVCGSERIGPLDGVAVEHLPTAARDRSGYLGLLRAAVTEEPDSARAAHLYGRELLKNARGAAAAAELCRHLGMEDPDSERRAMSMRYLARCEPGRAGHWLRRAVAEAPPVRDAWIDLAYHLYRRREWTECLAAATAALRLPDEVGRFPNLVDRVPALADDLAAVSGWRLGRREIALRHAARACALEPEDERLRRNLHAIASAWEPRGSS